MPNKEAGKGTEHELIEDENPKMKKCKICGREFYDFTPMLKGEYGKEQPERSICVLCARVHISEHVENEKDKEALAELVDSIYFVDAVLGSAREIKEAYEAAFLNPDSDAKKELQKCIEDWRESIDWYTNEVMQKVWECNKRLEKEG